MPEPIKQKPEAFIDQYGNAHIKIKVNNEKRKNNIQTTHGQT